jgi:rhodanese-related sulfurtransferase
MNLLSRWFRRVPTAPSWIGSAALAKRLERGAALLILDVRGPDEFTGPLGHIREATNIPLNELPAHLPDLARENRPVVVVCKSDRRSSMAAQQLQEGGMSDVLLLGAGWNSGECSACQRAEKRSKRRNSCPTTSFGRRGDCLGRRGRPLSRYRRCPGAYSAGAGADRT